jgi:S1-C subfamily serine protease
VKLVVRGVVIALLALAVIANGALAAAILVTREPAPKPLTAERVATASKPAIVFIQSDYTITTSLPQPKENADAVAAALQPRVDRGEITSQAQYDHAWWQLEMNNPDAYFTVGGNATDTWHQWATGSGFFVTEDGYLVTAAHVVSASKTEVRDGVIAATKNLAWIADVKNNIKKGWADYGPSDAEVSTYLDFWQRWIARYINVDKIDSRYYIGSGASVEAGDHMTSTGWRASVVSIDPTVGGHDIAILKVDVSGMPALPLASGDPKMGDATYAIGYPRTAYLQEAVPANQTVPVGVTAGKVQRMNSRTSPDGVWTVYGTDAPFTHGDSGGPIVDAKGRVMGVISFIIPDANGNQLPGQGYFVPTAFIAQDLAKANVSIRPDPKNRNLTNTYYHALAEGDIARYKVELNLLESIQARSSFDAYIKDDISHAQSEVLAGNDKTPPDLTIYTLPAAGSAAGVILVTLMSWLVLGLVVGRTAKPVPAAAPGPAVETVAVSPLVTNGGPATEAVASPQDALRESETVAQISLPTPDG